MLLDETPEFYQSKLKIDGPPCIYIFDRANRWVVKRDGTVLADAWLPDLVRLGGLEAHLGDGVIDMIAGNAVRNGRLRPRERRRLMSYPLVIRLVIAMTLLPGSSYSEAMRTLAGLLADIPFTLAWHIPTGKTVTGWRLLIPAEIAPAEGAIYELSPAVIAAGTEVARRIVAQGGAALFVDYGRDRSATGESLQAVRAHRTAKVLNDPGEADLSAHVDFAMLGRVARDSGAAVAGPVGQGAFLKALGIGVRADRLRRDLRGDAAVALDQAVARLTGEQAMGQLFKVLAVVSPDFGPPGSHPAGFETD